MSLNQEGRGCNLRDLVRARRRQRMNPFAVVWPVLVICHHSMAASQILNGVGCRRSSKTNEALSIHERSKTSAGASIRYLAHTRLVKSVVQSSPVQSRSVHFKPPIQSIDTPATAKPTRWLRRPLQACVCAHTWVVSKECVSRM